MQPPSKLVLRTRRATRGTTGSPPLKSQLPLVLVPVPGALATATMAVHGKVSSGGGGATALTMSSLMLLLLLCCCSLSTVQRVDAAFQNKISRLRYGYYSKTCPQAESIVRQAIAESYLWDRTIAPGLLRLFFHDCFIRGCDASVLLDKTPSGEPVEKASMGNGATLNENSLQVIDNIKDALEKRCPGVVSCADILAFATRDAAVMSGLKLFDVPGGRKDGRVSLAQEVILPSPYAPVEQLTDMFAQKGFSRGEMVVLSGAHSIGSVHCVVLLTRLYNFTTEGNGADPSMDPTFANFVKFQCPFPSGDFMSKLTSGLKVNFDRFSRGTLDNTYYKTLQERRGLLFSDQALMANPKTRTIVQRMATNSNRWAKKFAKAIVKLGGLDVLVENEGTVRSNCRVPN